MSFQNRPAIPVEGRQSETSLVGARGTRRLLRSLGYATVTEMSLPNGRRADIVALAGDGSIHIVEIKSSVIDFRVDQKWPLYRAHCDRLSFAVPSDLDPEILPPDTGLIVADAYGAALLRHAPEHRLPPATRRVMLLRFAQLAADRLHLAGDPDAALMRE